jgi:hypothetical protein
MIWDEKRQDANLRGFFRDLVAMRKKYLSVIENADISYRAEGRLHLWEFSHGGESLVAAYSDGEAAGGFEAPGIRLLCPDESDGNVPPRTLCVFRR